MSTIDMGACCKGGTPEENARCAIKSHRRRLGYDATRVAVQIEYAPGVDELAGLPVTRHPAVGFGNVLAYTPNCANEDERAATGAPVQGRLL